MKVLALVSSKGGSGKSTIAAYVAVAAVQAGKRVVILDADPQGSLSAWSGRRQTGDVGVISIEPSKVPEAVKRIRERGTVDLVVVDTAGVEDAGAVVVARAADLVLVPCKPTQFDIDGVTNTAAKLSKFGVPFSIVISQVPSGPRDRAREAAVKIAKLGRICPRFTTIRVAYGDALDEGQGITEYDPGSKAAQEIEGLWAWIQETDSDAARKS